MGAAPYGSPSCVPLGRPTAPGPIEWCHELGFWGRVGCRLAEPATDCPVEAPAPGRTAAA